MNRSPRCFVKAVLDKFVLPRFEYLDRPLRGDDDGGNMYG